MAFHFFSLSLTHSRNLVHAKFPTRRISSPFSAHPPLTWLIQLFSPGMLGFKFFFFSHYDSSECSVESRGEGINERKFFGEMKFPVQLFFFYFFGSKEKSERRKSWRKLSILSSKLELFFILAEPFFSLIVLRRKMIEIFLLFASIENFSFFFCCRKRLQWKFISSAAAKKFFTLRNQRSMAPHLDEARLVLVRAFPEEWRKHNRSFGRLVGSEVGWVGWYEVLCDFGWCCYDDCEKDKMRL